MTETTAPEWISGLTDESIKSDPSIQSFKSVEDLAKSFISTKALVGKKGFILPTEGAKDEEWEQVFNTLGRPEKSDGYKYQPPNGAKMNEEFLKEFRVKAHSFGLTQKQFEKLINYRVEVEAADQKKATDGAMKFKNDSESALRHDWGAKYDEKMASIQKAIKSYGGDLPDDPKAYDPRVVRLIGSLTEHLDEATIGSLGIVKGTALTPADALTKIAEIRKDPAHPLNVANHPGHKDAEAEMQKLYLQAYPGKKVI